MLPLPKSSLDLVLELEEFSATDVAPILPLALVLELESPFPLVLDVELLAAPVVLAFLLESAFESFAGDLFDWEASFE